MLDPIEMTRVRITGSKRVMEDTISTLHRLKAIHILDYRAGTYEELPEGFLDLGRPFGRAEDLSEKLVRVRIILNFLNAAKNYYPEERVNAETAWVAFQPIEKKVQATHEKQKTISENLRAAKIKKQKKETERLTEELKHVTEELATHEVQHGKLLKNYERWLTAENEKAEAPLRFAVSNNAFLIDGWIPENHHQELEQTLNKNLSGRIHVESFETVEVPPTELLNPKGVESFEFFLDLYSLPRKGELDPTWVIFFTFPLFYGFMLGDYGYGIATLLIFYLARRFKFPEKGAARSFLNAMMVASVGSIIFGLIFSEFFGFVFYKPLLDREHGIETILLISIIIGLLHITLAFVLQTMNAYKKGGLKKAFLKGGSWLILEAGALLMIASKMSILNFPFLFEGSGALMLAGVVLLYMGHGIHGIIELPAVLSNILSYARLFAIGLASVSLALIMNEMATGMIHTNIYFLPLAIMVLILGHGLNIGIGILGGFLQSLRLHYVEFFSKFYEGGGKKYLPFGRRRAA